MNDMSLDLIRSNSLADLAGRIADAHQKATVRCAPPSPMR